MIEAIKCTSHAISSNNSKPIYTALHFISDGTTLTVFSCDGCRAAIYQIPYESKNVFTISIPKESINILMSALTKNESANVMVILSKNRQAAFIIDKQTVIRTTLLYGEILPYQSLFIEKMNVLKVNKTAVLNILKGISTVLDDKNRTVVKIKMENSELNFSYNGTASEYSDCCSYEPVKGEEKFFIGMNLHYFTEALKAIPEDEVEIHFTNEVSPVTITPAVKTERRKEVIVLPMRINVK